MVPLPTVPTLKDRRRMKSKEHIENKTFADSETITYENIRKITIQKPRVKRDKRGGLHKLKEMVFFLRDLGYKRKQQIPFDDVKEAIMQISQGVDKRTIGKYLHLLIHFNYIIPKGEPIRKISRVTVTTWDKGDPKPHLKQYASEKGHSHYIFGLLAPIRYNETVLNVESVPPVPPLPSVDEESLFKRVTSEKCVCHSKGMGIGEKQEE